MRSEGLERREPVRPRLAPGGHPGPSPPRNPPLPSPLPARDVDVFEAGLFRPGIAGTADFVARASSTTPNLCLSWVFQCNRVVCRLPILHLWGAVE